MKIFDLKEQRGLKVAEMRGLLDGAEKAGRDLDDGERARFDQLKGEVASIETRIAQAETVAELERRADAAETLTEHGGTRALERRVSLLNVIRAQTFGTPLTGAEAEYSREVERRTGRAAQGAYVPLAALETRVNTTTSAPEIVPVEHRPDLFIGAFRERLVARRLGARVLSGLRGDLSIPRFGSGLSAGWVLENEAVPESNMDFDGVPLTPRHVGAVTELSRQLIQQSSPDVEQLARDDLAFVLAERIDAAMIDGGATAKEPTGIMRTSGVLSGTLAGPTWAQVVAMIGQLEDQNVPGPLQWLANPKASRVLRTTAKDESLTYYLMEGGRIGELPVTTSPNVPNPSGIAGTAILGDFTQVLLGIWSELDILVNPFAETAYRRGGVLVRAMATVDVGIRRPEAFVVADDIPIPA